MKKLLLFTLVIILNNLLLAQNYQTIRSDRTVLYDLSKSIRIDSIKIQGTDSLLYPFGNIQSIDGYCHTPYGASWTGKYVVIQENGQNLFFNKMNDTIKIKTNALLGESWLAYSLTDSTQIVATVFQFDTLSFLGIIDSVKTISFQVYDNSMTAQTHDLNTMSLLLSKNFGFVRMFNFYLFPSIEENTPVLYEQFQELSLLGLNHPVIGSQNLTWRDIYNYQVGDEVHVTDHHDYDMGQYNYQDKIYKYIDKVDYGDSILYTIDLEQFNESEYQGVYNSSYHHDTITTMIYENLVFDTLPSFPIANAYAVHAHSFGINEEGRRVKDIGMPLITPSGVLCWEWYWSSCTDHSNNYIEGLGGPYYGWVCPPDVNNVSLVYYHKGNEEWGTPLDLTDRIIVQETNISLKLYPNPASQNIVIQNDSFTGGEYELRIYNPIGKLVYTEIIESSKTNIDVSSWTNGIYFVVQGTERIKFVKE